MQANEEIDALYVLGVDPMRELVVPRVLVMMGMLPLLFFHACTAALIGGLLVAVGMLDLNAQAFVQRVMVATAPVHLWMGLAKTFCFGVWLALAGCHAGLRAQRSAAGVGQAATQAVVNGIVGLLATGGSTNHTIHLIAMARAAGVLIDWNDFSDLSAVVPNRKSTRLNSSH